MSEVTSREESPVASGQAACRWEYEDGRRCTRPPAPRRGTRGPAPVYCEQADEPGIIEPWLSYETRRSLANIAPYGMIIVFMLLWNTTVSGWLFNDLIYPVLGWFNAEFYALAGNQLFHFFSVGFPGFGN